MNDKYDVIIIGAGPAGLFSALWVKDKKVLIVEKNKSAGKKLLISGLGQCNYTNNCEFNEFFLKYGNSQRFLKPALYGFTNKDAIKFFEENGVKSLIREDNKVFPSTLKSYDILNVLLEKCKEKGIDIIYGTAAENVSYEEKDKAFCVELSNRCYMCEYLIIAAGGKSFPNTGSTGDGYKFAKGLGHTVIEPKQALTPVYVENYCFNDLAGISFENINITQIRNNKKINEYMGDLLFTHKNISGPVIINNSRYFNEGDILRINFTAYNNYEDFKKELENKLLFSGKLLVKTFLRELKLQRRFADKIFELSDIDDNKLCSQLDKKNRKELIDLLANHPMKVERLGDFNIAMVTKGGVSTKEINSKTMESKIIKNLYFAGEVIDIDGDTGGFNIQAAFSTGKLAGQSIH